MPFDIIVVGTSLGGFVALSELLAALPPDFATPIAIVQHRSVDSQGLLIPELRRQTRLRVSEPWDGEPVAPGSVYIAAADYHLLVEGGVFRLSTEGPVNYARPSIDVLFESASDAYGSRTLGIVLTGASADGACGAARIKKAGGTLVVQDPEQAECPVMPRAALQAATADAILTLSGIRAYLSDLSAGKRSK